MSAINSGIVLPCILPQCIDEKLVNEGPMRAISILTTKVVLGAIRALEDGQLKQLDPNPGDGGCQLRGYLLYKFQSDETLFEEARNVKERFEEIEKNVLARSNKRKNDAEARDFFVTQFGDLNFSKRLEFVFQCFLLQVTRTPTEDSPDPEGVIKTVTASGKLVDLCGRLGKLKNYVTQVSSKVTNYAQSKISEYSIELMQEEAERLENAFDLDMLSVKRVYQPDKKYSPKTIGLLFYQNKAILSLLRKQQGLICVKSIVPPQGAERPFLLFFRSKEPGAEFFHVEKPEENAPVVVFEGVVEGNNREALLRAIEEKGLTDLLLREGAIEPPIGPRSKLEDIENVQAREEINCYRKRADKRILKLDHVYCNRVKNELGVKT